MKNYNRYCLVILFVFQVFLVTAQNAFDKGNEAYKNENYKKAVKAYSVDVDSAIYSSSLYYNLGNAYYKTNNIGKSIWAFERALKIDPKNEDAKKNLDFVNLQTKDKIEQPKPAITQWLTRLLFGSQINIWPIISIICSFGTSFFIFLFFFGKTAKLRNFSLLGGVFVIFLLVFSVVTAHFHKNSILKEKEAVIIVDKVKVLVSPIKKSSVSFELHEGAKIQLIGENDNWINIEVNGNSGWVEEKSIWKI